MNYTEDQMTPWISGDVKPTRDGVYQREYGKGWIVYCKFKNGKWFEAKEKKIDANNSINISRFQNEPWRGLNFKAE